MKLDTCWKRALDWNLTGKEENIEHIDLHDGYSLENQAERRNRSHIDQTLVNSLHGPLTCEIGGIDCRVITTEYRTRSIVYTCNTAIL